MTVADLATTLAGFGAFFALVIAGLSWIAKKYITGVISDLTSNYLSELKPNSGSSMRDEVKSIRKDLTDLKVDVAGLEGKFDQHIRETAGF
jgi:hypothetical protein